LKIYNKKIKYIYTYKILEDYENICKGQISCERRCAATKTYNVKQT